MDTPYGIFEKPPNYRHEAHWLSAIFIWWTYHIFGLGAKRDLYESDLPEPLKEHTASILGNKIATLWSKEYTKAKIRQVKPSLTRVLCKCFLREYFAYGSLLAFMELMLKPTQPLFIGLLLRYFTTDNKKNTNPKEFPMYMYRLFYYGQPNQAAIQTDEAWLYASCVVICSLISVCIQHPYMLAVMHLGMKLRVACSSLMYRKTLRMSLLVLSPVTVGNVVNLMSNDATRFDMVTMFLHYLWISPLQLILFVYILYNHVGYAALIGGVTLVVFIPIQVILAHFNKGLRWKTAFKTDERVRLMNEIISGIQVIKMYAWEFAFCNIINKARRKEMRILVQTSYIRGVVMSMIMFTARCAIFVTLISMVHLFDVNISAENVFIISGYYIIIRASMTVFFPQGVTQFAETIITIQRTRDYLLHEDAIMGDPSILNPVYEHPRTLSQAINDKESSNFSIRSIVTDPSIRIIEVYAKWNTKFVLRDVELIMKQGQMVVLIGQVGSGKSSLLQVILKELPLYYGYVSVRGRVSYASQEPWLFAGSVRQNILFGHPYMKDRYRKVCKVCALLKDFKLLPFGDQTIVGEKGISLSGGQRARINLARCIYKEADIYIMDDPLSAVDTHVGAQMFNECITEYLQGKIRVLVTHQLQFLQNVDQLVIMEKGEVVASGTYDELQKSGVDFAQFLTLTAETSPEKVEAKAPQREVSATFNIRSLSDADIFRDQAHNRASLQETRDIGKISHRLYRRYWRSGANCFVITTVILLFIFTQGVASGTDFLIAQWVKNEDTKHSSNATLTYGMTTKQFMIAYSILTETLILSSICRSFLFFYVCLQSSIKLHDDMFNSIAFGHMRFFNINPSGRILNRFSKDMGAVDEDLPYAMIDFFQMLLNLIAVLIVLSVTSFYLIPPIVIILFTIYFIRRYYLKTSRSLKRVEGVVRSHVFAHLNASIQGLSTIRSHTAEQILVAEFDKHMDMHSSAWYLFISTARALSLWTDLICVSLVTISAFGFLILNVGFHIEVNASDVGLCITQCLQLTGLIPWGMRQSAEMENQMTSVERIIDYTNISQEPNLKSDLAKKPVADWPSEGQIIFKDTELKYSHAEEPVLHRINVEIQPKEKIGIVGRTGAGKSSIISALFRLAFQSGEIIIDGVNIFQIGLHDLRKKIAIIPQEPAIFTGNMRFNLDPFHEFADQILLGALSIVDLEVGKKDVLKRPLTEGGGSFSAGQKQLVCLARAIVRHNKILVLDEATANMDAKTDRLIQSTIRSKFASCTVLTIAHRLQTVMDSDKILVMHAGTVVEFDHPHILLSNPDGYFTSMVDQTGKSTADSLKKIAEQCYLRRTTDSTPSMAATDDEDDHTNF